MSAFSPLVGVHHPVSVGGDKVTIKERLLNLYEKWFLRHLRETVYTSIRPDLGRDDTTSSGYVELSRKVKK